MPDSLPRRALRALAAPLRRLRARLYGPRVARVGARPTWRFRRPLVEGGQVTSLADLRGKALLVHFTGLG